MLNVAMWKRKRKNEPEDENTENPSHNLPHPFLQLFQGNSGLKICILL